MGAQATDFCLMVGADSLGRRLACAQGCVRGQAVTHRVVWLGHVRHAADERCWWGLRSEAGRKERADGSALRCGARM